MAVDVLGLQMAVGVPELQIALGVPRLQMAVGVPRLQMAVPELQAEEMPAVAPVRQSRPNEQAPSQGLRRQPLVAWPSPFLRRERL